MNMTSSPDFSFDARGLSDECIQILYYKNLWERKKDVEKMERWREGEEEDGKWRGEIIG